MEGYRVIEVASAAGTFKIDNGIRSILPLEVDAVVVDRAYVVTSHDRKTITYLYDVDMVIYEKT